jgi:hypothetical protein
MCRVLRFHRQVDGWPGDEQIARTAASKLIEPAKDRPAAACDTVFHRSPWKQWVAVREDCFLRMYDEVFFEAVVPDAAEAGPSAFVAGLAEFQARRTAGGEGLMEFLRCNLNQFEPAVAHAIMDLAREVAKDEQSESGSGHG